MFKLIKILLIVLLVQFCLLQLSYADTSVEFGVEDDLTVNGTGGNSADADLEVKGYSLFGGTGAPTPLMVTSGTGNVYIQSNLEVGASSYLLGNSGVGTTEASARLLIKAADTGTGFTLRLQDFNKVDTACFLDNGNVGLGTTGPITQLHIPGKVPSSVVGSISTGVGSNPYSVYVQGRYAYTTDVGTDSLRIFDVSNPSSPASVGSVAAGDSPYSVYVQGRYAYVANYISATIQIFDVSNPASPSSVSSVYVGGYPYSVYVQGRYAYTVETTFNKLYIFDVSNPASPTRIGSVAAGTTPRSVSVQGRYAYSVDTGTDRLRIFDVSNPASPTSAGSVATGSDPYSVYVQGRYAYVVYYGATTDALQIFDVSNPASPSRVSSVATGADPYSVYVQGRYAYVVNYTASTLQIFDVSNPASPSSIGSVATGSGPYSVYVQGRYAYVVDATPRLRIFDVGGAYIQQLETGGLETGTLSTRSNAQVGNDLDVRGGLQVGRGAEVTGPFAVYGGLVASGTDPSFVVNYNGNVGIGTSAAATKLYIVGDVGIYNQGDLRLYEGDAGGSNYIGFQAPASVTSNVVYALPAADTSIGALLSTNGSGVLSWTISSGADITAVGSMTSGAVFADATADDDWFGLGLNAGRIEFDDQTNDEINFLNAYVGINTTAPLHKVHIQAADTGAGFTLRLQDSNLNDTVTLLDYGNMGIGTTAPITQLHIPGKVPTAQVGSVATGSSPISVYVQGRYAYVVNYTASTLQIFDVSNPASPSSIGSVATGADPYSVYVQGRYAYVVNYTASTLQIFDVSNPASPLSRGSVATGASPLSVYVQARYAYTANFDANTLRIFDLSNPASPTSVGSVGTGSNSNPRSVYVQGRYAYTANFGANALGIFDVSNPASPSVVSSAATGVNPWSVYVQGRYAYVVNYTASTLGIFDVSNPASPTSAGSVATGSAPQSVYVQGRYAYTANNDANTLQIFDVSNPASPVSKGSVATGLDPYSVYVQGRYAYVVNFTPSTLQIFDVGGSYIQQLETGGLETGTLSTRSNAQIGNDLDIRGGLQVGRGAEVTGPFSVYGGLVASGTDPSFVVNYNGNVGIGTSNPSAKLYIEGNLKAKMQTSMSGSLAKWEGGTAGTVYELGYDVAELFETTEEVSIGDLLVSDKDGKLKKSSQPYVEEIIGVVSAAPALLFEGSQLQVAPPPFEFQTGSKPPVALSGRVKVKVTLENGPIRTGDYLTSSSKPGYAMKADQSGRVIGVALENTDQETQITVFINPHWYGRDFTSEVFQELEQENRNLKSKSEEVEVMIKELEAQVNIDKSKS